MTMKTMVLLFLPRPLHQSPFASGRRPSSLGPAGGDKRSLPDVEVVSVARHRRSRRSCPGGVSASLCLLPLGRSGRSNCGRKYRTAASVVRHRCPSGQRVWIRPRGTPAKPQVQHPSRPSHRCRRSPEGDALATGGSRLKCRSICRQSRRTRSLASDSLGDCSKLWSASPLAGRAQRISEAAATLRLNCLAGQAVLSVEILVTQS